ncbi:MAG TPA: hypothetical protein VFH51_12800 [Myxococcota bacterium]|nr:hypothetical protein [Myxococcota bacterium]
MANITQDDSTFPLVRVTMTGAISPEETDAWMPKFIALTKRQVPCAVICDLTQMGAINPAVNKLIKKHMDAERDALRRYIRGVAVVMTSAPLRLAINTMLLVVRPPYPAKVVKNDEEAMQYCKERMESDATAQAS